MKTKLLIIIIFMAVAYWCVAGVTFALRHPWATQMEVMMHYKEMFTFQKISYEKTKEQYK